MGDYRYIVTRTVPSLQMMRVNVDRRRYWNFWSAWPVTLVKTHRPQTLRARLWRMILGG